VVTRATIALVPETIAVGIKLWNEIPVIVLVGVLDERTVVAIIRDFIPILIPRLRTTSCEARVRLHTPTRRTNARSNANPSVTTLPWSPHDATDYIRDAAIPAGITGITQSITI
jgi:hypothetical protein